MIKQKEIFSGFDACCILAFLDFAVKHALFKISPKKCSFFSFLNLPVMYKSNAPYILPITISRYIIPLLPGHCRLQGRLYHGVFHYPVSYSSTFSANGITREVRGRPGLGLICQRYPPISCYLNPTPLCLQAIHNSGKVD